MEISEEIRETHEDLSPTAGRFLDYVLRHPEANRRLQYQGLAELPEWVRSYPYALQSWPTFLGAAKLRQVERSTVELVRLVKSVPERIFDNDARRISEFYGFGNEALAAFLLSPPNGIAGGLARCDLIDDGRSFKCMEVNMTSHLGGWQLRFFEQICRANPAVASFIQGEGIRPVHRDPWLEAFRFMVEDTRRRGIAEGEVNVVLLTSPRFPVFAEAGVALNRIYGEVLAGLGGGLTGKVFLCSDSKALAVQGASLHHQGRRVHVLVEYSFDPTPPEVYRCFKAEKLSLYNGPVAPRLGDKRNLALLSQHADTDRFTSEERALVHELIPWSRQVVPGKTTFQGETVSLLDFATSRREDLVLKPGAGTRGQGIVIGRLVSPEEWQHHLRTAAGAAGGSGWMLQEFVRSRPYLYQSGDEGRAPHDMVWGTFCFGETYGGGFLRMMPSENGPGVVNSARGATEGLMFEV